MATVLIIDSESDVANALRDALQKRGATVKITGDGTEGLTLARTESPDVIVLCVELSRVSGYSICNKLKKDPALAGIPLILTSSQATEETFEQHKKLKTRAEQYLRKPFDSDQILGLIAQYADLAGGDDADLEVSIDTDDGLAPAVVIEPEPAKPAPAAKKRPTIELDEEALGGSVEEAVAAVPAAAARRATAAVVSDAEAERLRSEIRQLRQKVQKLEQELQDKELQFNDRLLQESERSRDGVELKKKIAVLERDMAKYKQAAEAAEAKATEMQREAASQKEQAAQAENETHGLSGKIAQLVEKVKELASERDQLRQDLEQTKAGLGQVSEDAEQAQKIREKVKKAIDIAVQLIDEAANPQ